MILPHPLIRRPVPRLHRLPRRVSYRAGHTLVEILLALGLSLVILVAIYGALDQHWRYAEAGQNQTERMQVSRALFERLSADLRAVVPGHPAMQADLPTARDPTLGGIIWSADESTYEHAGIQGNPDELIVYALLPDPAGNTGTQRIHWRMQLSTARRLDVAGRRQRPANSELRPSAGLTRSARGVPDIRPAADETTANSTDTLAQEVTSVQFRFFSKGIWYDRWDSRDRHALPQAVEVTIAFRPPHVDQNASPGEQSKSRYQLVIPIPASEV